MATSSSGSCPTSSHSSPLPLLSAAKPMEDIGPATDWQGLILDVPAAAWHGRDEEAAALILRAAELSVDRPYILHACAVMLLELDEPHRHLERALEFVQRAEALCKDPDGDFQDTRAMILAQLGQEKEATKTAGSSSRIAPVFEHGPGSGTLDAEGRDNPHRDGDSYV